MTSTAKSTLDDILKAGFNMSPDATMEFLVGMGVKTGTDPRYIDGYSSVEVVFNLSSHMFLMKKACTKFKETVKDCPVNKQDSFVQKALDEAESYLKQIHKVEQSYEATIAAKRQIDSGKGNVVMLRRVERQDTTSLRACDEPIRSLTETLKCSFDNEQDILEFLVGLGVHSEDGLRYLNGDSLRDSIRSMLSSLAVMKRNSTRAIKQLEEHKQGIMTSTGVVKDLYQYLRAFILGIENEEKDYDRRVAQHKMMSCGKVVPFRR